MSSVKILVCLGLCLFLGDGVSAKKKPKPQPPKDVLVDCFKGQSINAELEKNVGVDKLVVRIDGICEEEVVIRRSKVTLREIIRWRTGFRL